MHPSGLLESGLSLRRRKIETLCFGGKWGEGQVLSQEWLRSWRKSTAFWEEKEEGIGSCWCLHSPRKWREEDGGPAVARLPIPHVWSWQCVQNQMWGTALKGLLSLLDRGCPCSWNSKGVTRPSLCLGSSCVASSMCLQDRPLSHLTPWLGSILSLECSCYGHVKNSLCFYELSVLSPIRETFRPPSPLQPPLSLSLFLYSVCVWVIQVHHVCYENSFP